MSDRPTGDEPLRSKQMMMNESPPGMPPGKQIQSEEQLPALDDGERKAVAMQTRERLHARVARGSPEEMVVSPTVKSSARVSSAKTPKSGNRTPGYMTPKSSRRGAMSSRGAVSSRSSMLTNRTSSPTGRYHPDPERRLDVRKADILANIDYLAPNGAPDNDRKAKESSWLVSQAFIEGLRYYPSGQQSLDSNDCEATYSGNTHHKKSGVFENLETDLRTRLDINASTRRRMHAYTAPSPPPPFPFYNRLATPNLLSRPALAPSPAQTNLIGARTSCQGNGCPRSARLW